MLHGGVDCEIAPQPSFGPAAALRESPLMIAGLRISLGPVDAGMDIVMAVRPFRLQRDGRCYNNLYYSHIHNLCQEPIIGVRA